MKTTRKRRRYKALPNVRIEARGMMRLTIADGPHEFTGDCFVRNLEFQPPRNECGALSVFADGEFHFVGPVTSSVIFP